jgi:chemotaxis protein methyltransferase CheR
MPFDEFLRDVAPMLGLHGRAFRRRGIKRRLERRMADLGVSEFGEYLRRVREDQEELNRLTRIFTVTISRFFRDKDVFTRMEVSILPKILEKNRQELKIWSIGCASGEEPYSLAILWKEKFRDQWPSVRFNILATDLEEDLLRRAEKGRYKRSSLQEVPEDIRQSAFRFEQGAFVVDPAVRQSVQFTGHNVMEEGPFTGMDLILCRNLAFTYFSKERQKDVVKRISAGLKDGGYLSIGKTETLPLMYPTLFVPIYPKERIYQKFG